MARESGWTGFRDACHGKERSRMPKKAAKFVIELSKDPHKRRAFKQDPDGTMDAAGLSTEDKQVLKSGDPQKIREHLGDDGPPGCMVVF